MEEGISITRYIKKACFEDVNVVFPPSYAERAFRIILY